MSAGGRMRGLVTSGNNTNPKINLLKITKILNLVIIRILKMIVMTQKTMNY